MVIRNQIEKKKVKKIFVFLCHWQESFYFIWLQDDDNAVDESDWYGVGVAVAVIMMLMVVVVMMGKLVVFLVWPCLIASIPQSLNKQ